MSVFVTSEVNKRNQLNEALLDEKEHDIKMDGDIAKPAIQSVPKKCKNCDNLLKKMHDFVLNVDIQ